MRDGSAFIGVIATAIYVLFQLVQPLIAGRRKAGGQLAASRRAPPHAFAPTAPPPSAELLRATLFARLAAVEARAAALVAWIGRERAAERFVEPLTKYVPTQASVLRSAAGDARGRVFDPLFASAALLEIVVAEIEALIRQRQDPGWLALLGDADALAEACYEPVVTFARAEGLPLRTARPVTQLAPTNLAIWTGFAPTSLAPIFLPRTFFHDVIHWPGIAHEIGHDVLLSMVGLEDALRRELALVSADEGSRPIDWSADTLSASEVERVCGAWFEEVFCDVFGALMCGPSYVLSMTRLFAARVDAREVLVVESDPSTGRYGSHPPDHLRVLLCCGVLARAGIAADAARLEAAWRGQHAAAGETLNRLLFPLGARYVALPLGPFLEALAPRVGTLVTGGLRALSGFGLQDVSGLDYGPREHAAGLRVCSDLLAGHVPAERDPRAVIAGAVLAAAEAPARALEILSRARAAIPAIGTRERRPDAQHERGPSTSLRGLGRDRRELVQALALREALTAPVARRRRAARLA